MGRQSAIAVMLMFFGGAAVDAVETHNWGRVALWMAFGVASAWLALRRPSARTVRPGPDASSQQ